MKRLILISGLALSATGCGPAGTAGANATAAKTNINTVTATPYLQTENAYTFAQISDFTQKLSPSGKEARELVGKTVSESKLWENRHFTQRLNEVMGPDFAPMRKSWNVETPIKKFGDFLMMTGCEDQQSCADNRYVIFIDLGDLRVNVIHIDKDSSREWHSNRRIEYLPPPFEEELRAMRLRQPGK